MKYYVDGLIIKAYTDYDSPKINKSKNIIFFNDTFDYKAIVYVLKKSKIYKQYLTFDDDTISVKTKLVYSFDHV